jgi:hypothetical protein
MSNAPNTAPRPNAVQAGATLPTIPESKNTPQGQVWASPKTLGRPSSHECGGHDQPGLAVNVAANRMPEDVWHRLEQSLTQEAARRGRLSDRQPVTSDPAEPAVISTPVDDEDPTTAAAETVVLAEGEAQAGPRQWGWARANAVLAGVKLWLGHMDEAPVRKADRAAWAAAGSLADLGTLTAAWLAGDLASQPGYYGTVDVDEDAAPGLTAALIGLCRAGGMTAQSQAGYAGPGLRGRPVEQLAWVDLFASDRLLDVLTTAAAGTPYRVAVLTDDRIPVTWWAGKPCTSTSRLPRRDLAFLYRGDIGPDAWQELTAAHQIAVIDPIPGRNTLWAWLTSAVGAR